ncbi:MAG: undecaprenyl-diphosphate phosphatase [Phycisphaeraceae bacterium]|nr:undecaprenyl-diphosphate phosphatase [Phycisphaeraceae bacterium]
MEWWQSIILGLVEGITEYLPVSSTGHLILVSNLIGLGADTGVGGGRSEAVKSFEVVIQAGAILAVVGLYWPRFVQMLRGLIGRDPVGMRLLVNLGVAFVPAVVVGLLVNKFIKAHLFYPVPVVAALMLGGVYMMGVEAWRVGRFSVPRARAEEVGIEDLTVGKSLVIGLLQCVAMWPGTSRSMMTITGGYFVGLRPAAAAEFSFLLGVPTLTAAAAWDLYKDLKGAGPENGGNLFQHLGATNVVLGILVAAVSAALAVKWLVGFLNRRGLAPFGWYRLLIGVVMAGLILGQIVRIAPEPRPAAAVPAPAATNGN